MSRSGLIRKTAHMIEVGLTVHEIREILVGSGLSESRAYLIYKAAEILSAARTAE